jgi:hypothetical protein
MITKSQWYKKKDLKPCHKTQKWTSSLTNSTVGVEAGLRAVIVEY